MIELNELKTDTPLVELSNVNILRGVKGTSSMTVTTMVTNIFFIYLSMVNNIYNPFENFDAPRNIHFTA